MRTSTLLALGILLCGAGLATAEPVAEGETPGVFQRALGGPLADVEEVIYAVRGPGREWHFYANFGYVCQSPRAKKYGGGPGLLRALNIRTGEVRNILVDNAGAIRDPDVHYSGEKILFSYRPGGTEYYHLYEINSDGTGLKQLTSGPWDDMEPCYTPDGSIVFSSSRCARYVPCYKTQVATLYRCNADGTDIRQLTPNVETESTPAMMPDGRVIYMRWEYVNRGVMEFHHLWTMNPDGTGQMVYYGNMHDDGYADLLKDVLMTEPRPVPGTEKVSAIFSEKHGKTEHVGHVFMVDAKEGPDALERPQRVSHGFPGVPDPKPGAKPSEAWRDPYPFSEDCFLVASLRGLYVMDGAGRFEKIHEINMGGAWLHEPRPLRPREREPVIPPRTDWSKTTGTMMLNEVHTGRNMQEVEPGEITELAIMEVLPAPVHFGAGSAPIGDNNIKRVLGTVPVKPDGSAHFELPARRAYTFVARNAEGNAVKIMNSFTTVLPGETVGCVGCHEPRTEAPPPVAGVMPTAVEEPPDEIRPFEGVPDIIGFNRHIQPILDKHCVKCHNPKKDKGPNLNGENYVLWSNSYRALSRPWNIGVRGSNKAPYSGGSGSSKLIKMLQEGHKKVDLSPAEFETIRLWVDAGGIYAGTYGALGDQLVHHEIDRRILEEKCYSCHVKKKPRRGEPRWPFDRFFHTDFNMTRPEKSRFLIKPLAESAGGRATQADPEKSSKRDHYIVFESKEDPAYQALVRDVEEYVQRLEQQRWYMTPNWRPNEHYFREMKRYGVLPPNFDPEKDALDPFEIDRRYYELFYPDGD